MTVERDSKILQHWLKGLAGNLLHVRELCQMGIAHEPRDETARSWIAAEVACLAAYFATGSLPDNVTPYPWHPLPYPLTAIAKESSRLQAIAALEASAAAYAAGIIPRS